MGLNLGEFRQRNVTRKGQTKRDVDTLIDLVEQLHCTLLRQAVHTEECTHPDTHCSCGLNDLGESILFDFDKYLRRKHTLLYFPGIEEPPTLAEIYET
jgi:hypothetical protein